MRNELRRFKSFDQRIELNARAAGASFEIQAIEDGLARFKLVDYIGTQAKHTRTHTLRHQKEQQKGRQRYKASRK